MRLPSRADGRPTRTEYPATARHWLSPVINHTTVMGTQLTLSHVSSCSRQTYSPPMFPGPFATNSVHIHPALSSHTKTSHNRGHAAHLLGRVWG